jgi:hypothetical protein
VKPTPGQSIQAEWNVCPDHGRGLQGFRHPDHFRFVGSGRRPKWRPAPRDNALATQGFDGMQVPESTWQAGWSLRSHKSPTVSPLARVKTKQRATR